MSTTALPARTTAQHSCSLDTTVRCPRNKHGRPRTKRCPVCHAPWYVVTGYYGVFTWTGLGDYRLADAHHLTTSPSKADHFAKQDTRYVVRFVIV